MIWTMREKVNVERAYLNCCTSICELKAKSYTLVILIASEVIYGESIYSFF